MAKDCYTREQIEETVKDKGYKWFDDKNNKGYDVNIVGVRNDDTGNQVTNKFDDWKQIFEKHSFKVTKFSPHEMMALRGKLGKFHFYKLPKNFQNMIKRIAYDYSNKKMNDTSFILTKIS